MKRVVQLVDNTEYVNGNCFQHQLLDGLRRSCLLTTIALPDAISRGVPSADHVVCCLKMRTLDRSLPDLARVLAGRRVTVYDQDPWESFKTTGVCNGAYARVVNFLDVENFAITTLAWKDRLTRLGFPAVFVKMGMLPKYCDASPGWNERDIDVGFIGQLHPYRLELFDALRSKGINVKILSGRDYARYLSALSRIKIFVHRESGEYTVNGEIIQYAEGLWAKDVEACSRGCISVRNWHDSAYDHMPVDLIANGLRMFDDSDVEHAVRVIQDALKEQHDNPQAAHEERVACCKAIALDDAWVRTARVLIGENVND